MDLWSSCAGSLEVSLWMWLHWYANTGAAVNVTTCVSECRVVEHAMTYTHVLVIRKIECAASDTFGWCQTVYSCMHGISNAAYSISEQGLVFVERQSMSGARV